MEPEGSLQYSQVHATCLYHEPARSNPYTHPTSWRAILILSSHLRLGLSSALFPSGFPTNTPYNLSPIRATFPAHLIFSILSPEQYWVSSTDQSGGIAILILYLGCNGGFWSVSRSGHFISRKEHRTHRTGGWLGPSRSGRFREENSLLFLLSLAAIVMKMRRQQYCYWQYCQCMLLWLSNTID
jgi:hypothetical protein